MRQPSFFKNVQRPLPDGRAAAVTREGPDVRADGNSNEQGMVFEDARSFRFTVIGQHNRRHLVDEILTGICTEVT